MNTIYLVEWRFKNTPDPWRHCGNVQVAPSGYLLSYTDAQERIELFGSHDRCEYRIVPYVRGEV